MPLWTWIFLIVVDGIALIIMGCVVVSMWKDGSRPWKP